MLLLAGFVLVEAHVNAPLLPPRVVLNRVRGASYLSVAMSGIAIFGVFLFLTFYIQQAKGFSPVVSGLSFLPLTVCIITASSTVNIVLLPRNGPRPLVTAGMLLGAAGMVLLAQLTPTSSYATGILPGLCVLGLGFGLIFAPAISSATFDVAPGDVGVASAMVNTMQQVGGSIGTALLSTVAATSTLAYARSHEGALEALSTVHGFTTAFTISAAILAAVRCSRFCSCPADLSPQQRRGLRTTAGHQSGKGSRGSASTNERRCDCRRIKRSRGGRTPGGVRDDAAQGPAGLGIHAGSGRFAGFCQRPPPAA